MFRVELPMRMADDPAHETPSLKANANYWWEGVAYEITKTQADELRQAALKIIDCYAEAMDYVVSTPAVLRKFHYGKDRAKNKAIQTLAAESWKDPSQRGYILDRWDMAWDGVNPPKLLERNFGYMGLIESTGVVQEDYIDWLKTRPGYEDVSSFGNLRESFIRAFSEVTAMRSVTAGSTIELMIQPDGQDVDKGMIETGYLLAEWIRSAGFKPAKIAELALSINMPAPYKVMGADLAPEVAKEIAYVMARALHKMGQPEDVVINLLGSFGEQRSAKSASEEIAATYPFYNIRESRQSAGSAAATPEYKGAVLEPAWTRLMDHKYMLPILHQLFPDHPNILPAVEGKKSINGQKSFAKLVNGCQGLGARVLAPDGKVLSKRLAFKESKRSNHYITQAYCDAVVNPDGSHKVVHLFTANGQPAAIGTREAPFSFVGGSNTGTKFVPVIVRPDASTDRSFTSYEMLEGFGQLSAVRCYRLPPNFSAMKRIIERDP